MAEHERNAELQLDAAQHGRSAMRGCSMQPPIVLVWEQKSYTWDGKNWYGTDDCTAPPLVISNRLDALIAVPKVASPGRTVKKEPVFEAPEPVIGKKERVLELPEKSIGRLFFRSPGRERWTKIGPAQGRIPLRVGKEHKLRLEESSFFHDTERIVRDLTGISCDLLTEIEAPLRVMEVDLWDQAVSGVFWYSQQIKRAEVKVKAAIQTSARLVFPILPM